MKKSPLIPKWLLLLDIVYAILRLCVTFALKLIAKVKYIGEIISWICNIIILPKWFLYGLIALNVLMILLYFIRKRAKKAKSRSNKQMKDLDDSFATQHFATTAENGLGKSQAEPRVDLQSMDSF